MISVVMNVTVRKRRGEIKNPLELVIRNRPIDSILSCIGLSGATDVTKSGHQDRPTRASKGHGRVQRLASDATTFKGFVGGTAIQLWKVERVMPKRSIDASEVLSFKALMIALAVYAYFAGWIYAFAYYRHFGLSLNLLDIPLQHFYVFAYSAFDGWSGVVVMVIGLAVGTLLTIWRFGRWLVLPLALGAIPTIFHLAYSQGEADAVALRHRGIGSKVIHVQFKTPLRGSGWAQELSRASDDDRLRLIVQTKDDYYVLFQPLDRADELPLGTAYQIRKQDLVVAAIDVPQTRIQGESK